MKTVVLATCLLAGLIAGYLLCVAVFRVQRSRAKRKRQPAAKGGLLRSITRFLFVTTQVFALGWVTWTYIIASYSTIVLLQPFPAEALSQEAVRTILGVGFLKVLENIFEHNEGKVFGKCTKTDTNANGETEGVG